MNLMFILWVCFSGAFLAIAIASAAMNILPRKGSQSPRWMGRLRQFQSGAENSGWRIQMIPYDDGSRPLTIPTRGLLGIVPILGAFGFLFGMALVSYDRSQFAAKGVTIAVSGWLIALVGALVKRRWGVETFWDVAPGRCVDRELRKVLLPVHGGTQLVWVWRVVCQYEYLGIPYRVTPEISSDCFDSEEAARAFLDKRISTSSGCTLRVNPKNPLQATLIEQGSGSIAL